MERLPFESIIYFGDTARVPYGVKPLKPSPLCPTDHEFLLQQQVKLSSLRATPWRLWLIRWWTIAPGAGSWT